MTFVQITPMGVSFMSPVVPIGEAPQPALFSQDFVKLTLICSSLHLAIQCILVSPFTHTNFTSQKKKKRWIRSQQQTQNNYSLTMQQVLGHSVQGQKAPCIIQLPLRHQAIHNIVIPRDLIQISQRFYKNTESWVLPKAPGGNLEFVSRTRWFSHQVSLLNTGTMGTPHIQEYSSNTVQN